MKVWSLVFATALVMSCSDGDDDKKAAATVKYGELVVVSSDIQTPFDLTQASCSSDSNSGLFSASFSGESASKLEIRIKGFSTQGQTYTCTQSTDNVDGDIGQRFDGCMVEVTVPDSETGLNTYSMHRSAEGVKDFTYSGACTVSTQYAAPEVTVTVNCADLVQTVFQSAARNPIDELVTIDVHNTTVVKCNI